MSSGSGQQRQCRLNLHFLAFVLERFTLGLESELDQSLLGSTNTHLERLSLMI